MTNFKSFLFKEFIKRITSASFNINLFFHFLVLLTFLTIFFISFISKISTNAFNDEVSNLTSGIVKSNIQPLKKETSFNESVKMLPLQTLYDSYNNIHEGTKNRNDGLVNNLILFVVFSWILFIVIIVLLQYTCNIDLNLEEVILENAITFCFVGLFEYYFFTRIANSYIPVEPSFISQEFLNSIKNKIIS